MDVHKSMFNEFWHCIVPFGTSNDPAKAIELRKWCKANFDKVSFEDLYNNTSVLLYNETDVFHFVLKWS